MSLLQYTEIRLIVEIEQFIAILTEINWARQSIFLHHHFITCSGTFTMTWFLLIIVELGIKIVQEIAITLNIICLMITAPTASLYQVFWIIHHCMVSSHNSWDFRHIA